MRPRRVLVQVNSLALGGTQINAVDLAAAVRHHGFESVVFGPTDTLPKGPSLLDLGAERGVPVQAFERAPSVLAGGAGEFRRRTRAVGAELVHVYGAWGGAREAFWGPCFAARRPLVHTVYEMSVSPQVYSHVPLIIGTGYLRDELVERPGLTQLISPPVDVHADQSERVDAEGFVRKLGLPSGSRRVVLVSRLDKDMKVRSVETAIGAMREMAGLSVVLVLVGGGSAEDHLRGLAAKVNAEAGERLVVMTGSMADPRPAYACAHVALGMGGSAARALSLSRPLVVQGEYGHSELFEPTSAESLFRRSFWNETPSVSGSARLAATLRELLDDESRREELGAFGRSFAVAHFGLEEMAARLAEVYRRARAEYSVKEWMLDLPLERRALTRSYPFKSTEPRFWSRS